MENNEFLTESQTLAYAGIDRNILTRFCETGYIKTKMLANGQVLYSKSEIERVFGKRREALGGCETQTQSVLETPNPQINQKVEQRMVANMGGMSYEANPNNMTSRNYTQNDVMHSTSSTMSTGSVNVGSMDAGSINNMIVNNMNDGAISSQSDNSRLIKFPQNTKYYENSKQNVSGNYQQHAESYQTAPNASRNISMPQYDESYNSQKFMNLNSQPSATNNVVVKEPIYNNQMKQDDSSLESNSNLNRENEEPRGEFSFNAQDLLKSNSTDNLNTKKNSQQHNANSEQVKKLQGEVENLKQEIVKLQSYARLQKKLLEVKEKEISELKQEKDWLKNRIESQEEKNNRDQLLILSETRVIHNLIASNQKSSPIRAALEWFGFAKKNRTETIDMVKQ